MVVYQAAANAESVVVASPCFASGERIVASVIGADELTASDLEQWENLCLEHAHLSSPFLSPHYARAVSDVRPHVRVCILRQDDRIVGVFPFQFATSVHRTLGAADRLGGEMTDYCGLIAVPGLAIGSDKLLALSGLRHFMFSHLDYSQTQYGLSGDRSDTGLLIDLRNGHYWADLRARDKRFVQDTVRRQKRLEAEHGALRVCTDVTDWRAPLEQLISQKRSRYRQTGVRDALRESWTRRLLVRLAQTRSSTCRGVLSTLHAGDTWVASQFGLIGGGVLHYWFPVYNDQLAVYAPGRLLLKLLIDAAPAMGVEIIDRGAGDSKAKRDFANSQHSYWRGAWYSPGLRARLYRFSCSLRWRLGVN